MDSLVPFEVITSAEDMKTLVTFVSFYSSVTSDMQSKETGVCRFPTIISFIWFLSFMNSKIKFTAKLFSSLITVMKFCYVNSLNLELQKSGRFL